MSPEHLHSAGDSDPSVPVAAPVPLAEPVAALAGIAVATELAAGLTLAARRARTAGLILAIGTVATAAAAIRVRDLVTPIARPQDDDGDPLTPVAIDEPEPVARADDTATSRAATPTGSGTDELDTRA